MELNSPRKDPYSSMARAEDELKKKGYGQELQVIDEKTLKDGEGNSYKPDQLQLDHIIRLPERKPFLANEDKVREPKAIYALNANNGMKGVIKEVFSERGSEVIEKFLQNVDKNDSLEESYTA